MKIETQSLEDHQVKLSVEVEGDKMESAKRQAARKLARRMKIPGFRPGKAPYHVVVRYAGEATIVEEGLEILIQDIYPQVIEEAEIEPYGPGTLENVTSMDPPVLEFVIPLEAEVELGNYKSIRRPYEPDTIEDDNVDSVIDNLREQQAITELVDRSSQDGDLVNVLLSGKYLDPEEGQDPDFLIERSMPLIVISAETIDEDEWPFPGFSRNLVDMSVGDEKTITHTSAGDLSTEIENEIVAEYTFVIKEIRSRTLPELDDDFAESVGDYESMDALREYLKTTLEQNNINSYNENYDEAVLEELINQSTIKYPPQMLDRQIDGVINNLKANLEQQNLDLDLYLKSREMSLDELREEATPVAEERLKRTLVIMELAQEEEIQVDAKELEDETQLTIETLSQNQSKGKKELSNEDMSNLVGNIMTTMVANRAMERLHEISSSEFDEEAHEDEDINERDDGDNENSDEEFIEPPASESKLPSKEEAVIEENVEIENDES